MSVSPGFPTPPTSPSRSERRRTPRRSVVDQQIVSISLDRDNGGVILDLSSEGMAVQAVAGLQKGATAEFEFALPDSGTQLRGRGRVIWAEQSGRAGLRILDLSEGSLAALCSWLSQPATSAPSPTWSTAAAPLAAELDAALLQREPAVRRLGRDAALQFIAESTRELACATGVAIALRTGDEMICRASTGAAPDLGVRLQAESGLSGECVSSGLLVRCDDTETDPRVDADICRKLELRSAVLVPVFDGEQLCGVLEIFSNRPRAFRSLDIARLRQTADLIAGIQRLSQSPPMRADVPPAVMQPATSTTAAQEPAPARIAPAVEPALSTPAQEEAPLPAVPEAEVVPAASVPSVFGLEEPAFEEQSGPALRITQAGKIAVGFGFALALTVAVWALFRTRPRPPIAPPPPVTAPENVSPVTMPAPEAPASEVPAVPQPAAEPPREAPVKAVVSPTVEVEEAVASPGVVVGRLIHRVSPVYPSEAMKANIGGEVVLEAVIRADGSVGAVGMLSGNPTLASAAVEAVRQWKYEPFTRNGAPTEASQTIRFKFNLRRR